MAACGGTGAATRFVFGSSPAAAGLCAIEETTGRICESAEEGRRSGVCRADRFSCGVVVGVRDRDRVLDWQQDAHSVEGFFRT